MGEEEHPFFFLVSSFRGGCLSPFLIFSLHISRISHIFRAIHIFYFIGHPHTFAQSLPILSIESHVR
jgi:hypothetical protein